jgi:hypothetical protein
MNNIHYKKLPVTRIILSSMMLAWQDKAKFSKALALPTLTLVVVWAITSIYVREIAEISAWLPVLFYGIGFSVFAVACHRLVLVDQQTVTFGYELKARLLKFCLGLIMIYAILYLIMMVPLTVMLNISPSFRQNFESDNFTFATILASIPAFYVVGRLSLIFPAIAIDHTLRLKESWALTRDNGWRMAIIVGFYPSVIKTVITFIPRDTASAVEGVIIMLLYYYASAMAIFALSLSYKEITKT